MDHHDIPPGLAGIMGISGFSGADTKNQIDHLVTGGGGSWSLGDLGKFGLGANGMGGFGGGFHAMNGDMGGYGGGFHANGGMDGYGGGFHANGGMGGFGSMHGFTRSLNNINKEGGTVKDMVTPGKDSTSNTNSNYNKKEVVSNLDDLFKFINQAGVIGPPETNPNNAQVCMMPL